MLERLQKLIETSSSKSLGNNIKKDKELLNWVYKTTGHLQLTLSLSERAFLIINDIISNCCNITAGSTANDDQVKLFHMGSI